MGDVAAFGQDVVALSRSGLLRLIEHALSPSMARNFLLLDRVSGWIPEDEVPGPKVLNPLLARGLLERRSSTGEVRVTEDGHRVASLLRERE